LPTPLWPPLLAAFFTLAAATTIRLYTVAHSESLFLPLWLGSFFLLDRYGERPSPSSLLLAALTALTRYAGVAFILSGAAWLLLRRGGESRPGRYAAGVFAAGVFAALSLLPLVLWLLAAGQAGGAGNREIAVHWVAQHHLWQALYTLSAWTAPDNLPLLARLLLWLLLVIVLIGLILRRQFAQLQVPRRIPGFFSLLGLNIIVYLAFLLFSISFLDVQIRLTERILAPVYLSLLLLGGTGDGRLGTGAARLSLSAARSVSPTAPVCC
jgi:hypothetical protein